MGVNGCEWFIDDAGDPLKQTNSAEVLSGSLGPLERLVFIDKRPQCVEHLAKEAWMQRLAKSKMHQNAALGHVFPMFLGKFAGRHGLSHEIEVFPADFPFDSLRRIWDPLDHSVLASSAKFWRLRAWPGS